MKTTATKRAKAATTTNDLPVNISHSDKVFWPEDGYTKGDLAEFYESIFSKLEPYLKGRLLTLERCPDGMAGQCFYQKEMPKGMPANTPTKRIKNEESKRPFTNYVVGGTLETQLALVNLGCIAIHAMGGRAGSPRQPDWVCFDLDPDSGEFPMPRALRFT
jgi:bifunctional non-homologous end joining protein LigD